MGNIGDGSGPYHNVGHPFKDWLYERRNIIGVILIVSVGINNDVSPKFCTRIKAGDKSPRKPLVFRKTHNVVDTTRFCDINRSIGAPIINYKPLYPIKSLHFSRKFFKCQRKSFCLIVAGYLYN